MCPPPDSGSPPHPVKRSGSGGTERLEEFHYRVKWRAASPHPGGHPSRQRGGGFEFTGLLPFMASPHPRDLDLGASLKDPFGELMVRSYRQRSSIPVFVLADLSASMAYSGCERKAETLARFVASAAWSAYRQGDRFGFIGCDERVREELRLPLRFQRGAALDLYEKLLRHDYAHGRKETALVEAAQHLGLQKALVFLVSDFHFPKARLESLMKTLGRHDLVPVVLWDRSEFEQLPTWGLVHVEDPESGRKRRLFMRPALREQFRERYRHRREELIHLCRRQGRSPFFVVDRFDADALSRYFMMGG